jgi:hypothetical protein
VLHTQTQGADIFATDRVTSRFNPNPIKRAINRYGSGNLGTPRISFEEGNPARRESRGYCAIAFGIAAVFAIDTTLPALQLGQALQIRSREWYALLRIEEALAENENGARHREVV